MSRRHIAGAAIAVVTLAAIGVAATSAASDGGGGSAEPESIEIEIAEDAARFAFDEAPVFDDGMPGYGNQFATQGFIYEPGTLALGGGVKPDGSATHPDRVLGTWICEGVLLGDGAHTETGPWVASTQIYDFGDFDGDDIVITHGVETPEIGSPVDRAVIGGTGEHAGAAGIQSQVLQGFSTSGGVKLTVTLTPAVG